ncbi:MAG: LysM peptidoglycan-binding domain-containing protein [Desulfobacterales bacterium]|nr:LysM peptidoglycan-binding domain-containing protein [Desulfobacterales bacterium]
MRTFSYSLSLLCLLALLGGCASVGDESTGMVPLPAPVADDPVEAPRPGPDLESAALPEPEETIPQEIDELQKLGRWEQGQPAAESVTAEITYDFPVTVNRQVEYYLDFFQNRHRPTFARWLARSSRYLPMIEETFKEAGLPLDLAYLAMIESGFNEAAYSRARAMGMWQFMKGTGRHYGLEVNNYVDERRNPVKATAAAAAYLAELYQEFGSWYLAVAGYNAGEGKIRRAIRKYKSRDFWKLAEGRYLRPETKLYVPKLIAAIMIAKQPEKYGFADIRYDPPLEYDTVEVPRWTALKAVSLAAGTSEKHLQRLNRELRKPFTPPDNPAYALRVPKGKKELVARNLPRVHATVSTNYKTHVVRKGESLDTICKRYGLGKTIILKANNLPGARLQIGQRLRVPFRTTSYVLLPEGRVAAGYALTSAAGGDFVLHRIRPGETVSSISQKYNVPAHLIAAWNDLKDIGRIRAGQQLALYVRDGNDTAAAEHAAARQPKPRGKTGARVRTIVSTGRKTAVTHQDFYYRVRPGDSLWRIAQRYRLSPMDIKQWNNLKQDLIHPGNRLLLKLDKGA